MNSALDALKPLWDWAWDNFLEPVAEWTGGMIVDILKDLAAELWREYQPGLAITKDHLTQ